METMKPGKIIMISVLTTLGILAVGYVLIAKFGDFSDHKPAFVPNGEAPIKGEVVK